MSSETPAAAENRHVEQTDAIRLPAWIATSITLVVSVLRSDFGLSRMEFSEFSAIFCLSFIALTKVSIALSDARRERHGQIMLLIGAGVLFTIAMARFASEQEWISTANSRYILGWGYVVWSAILILAVNRLRILRWLRG